MPNRFAQPQPPQPATPEPLQEERIRLCGPAVGDYSTTQEPDTGVASSSVPLDTLSLWIQREDQQHISSLELYVHMHRNAAKLDLFSQEAPDAQSLGRATHMLDPYTAQQLGLGAPTHTLTITCDCAAPRARLDLYIMNATRASCPSAPPQTAARGAPRPSGWRLGSADVVHGFDMPVRLPLFLDDQWRVVNGTGPLALALVIEALDEDGQTLAEPNAETMYFVVESIKEGTTWQLINGAQTVYLNGYAMQLHELFGMTANQAGAKAHEEDANAPELAVPEPDNEATECPICMTLEPTTVLLPCTHALCFECAVRVCDSVQKSRTHDRSQGRAPRLRYACPICRAAIQSMLALSR